MPTSVTVPSAGVVLQPLAFVAQPGCTPPFPATAVSVQGRGGTLYYDQKAALACATDAAACVRCPSGRGTWGTQTGALVQLTQADWDTVGHKQPVAGFCSANANGAACLLPVTPNAPSGAAALRCGLDSCTVTFP